MSAAEAGQTLVKIIIGFAGCAAVVKYLMCPFWMWATMRDEAEFWKQPEVEQDEAVDKVAYAPQWPKYITTSRDEWDDTADSGYDHAQVAKEIRDLADGKQTA